MMMAGRGNVVVDQLEERQLIWRMRRESKVRTKECKWHASASFVVGHDKENKAVLAYIMEQVVLPHVGQTRVWRYSGRASQPVRCRQYV